MEYNKMNVAIGDQVITQEDMDTGAGWGEVVAIGSNGVDAVYRDGETYSVEYWAIIDKKTANSDKPVEPNEETPKDVPLVRSDRLLGADQQSVVVKPGTIVTFSGSGKRQFRTMDANRLWVVLAWTKNSNKTAVNIYPVNGPQAGEKFAYSYVRVNVSECKPVKFGSYVKKSK